jgi:hypothetical protein
MASKAQTSGMRGVYLVASELARNGLITSPTSRSARGADILATTLDCKRALSVEVKTTTNNKFWQLGEHARSVNSASHVYVFVHIEQATNGEERITYYPVSSKFISENARLPNPRNPASKQYRKGFTIDLRNKYPRSRGIQKFEGKWDLFQVQGPKGKRLRVKRR